MRIDLPLREIITEATITNVKPWLVKMKCRLCGSKLIKNEDEPMNWIRCSNENCVEWFTKDVALEILK